MISARDRAAVAALAQRYHARRVLLFGSSASSTSEGRDIDLGVEGIAPAEFFKFYGDLIFSLSKPVDLIDLSEETSIARVVRQDGVPLYG